MSIPMPIRNTTKDDISWLVASAKNEPTAFARIYDHFANPVYRYLFSRVGNQADAEDLAAQTFLTALEKLPRYREQGHFKAWLFTIARNKALDHFRKQRSEDPLDASDPVARGSDLLSNVIRSERIGQLTAAIQELEDYEQELLRLRYVADLSFAEMATVLGKNQDTVKKALYRLQARLQSLMEATNV